MIIKKPCLAFNWTISAILMDLQIHLNVRMNHSFVAQSLRSRWVRPVIKLRARQGQTNQNIEESESRRDSWNHEWKRVEEVSMVLSIQMEVQAVESAVAGGVQKS